MPCVSLTPAFARCKPPVRRGRPKRRRRGGTRFRSWQTPRASTGLRRKWRRRTPPKRVRFASGEGGSLIDRDERRSLDAAGPGELPGLKAFLAEDRAALRRLERHGRLLAAGRARGGG